MTTTTYASDRTTLLIVDPYNDFMSEGGKFYEATKETAQAVGFYDNMRKLIPAIYELARENLLCENSYIVGYSRSPMSDEAFRKEWRDSIQHEPYRSEVDSASDVWTLYS